MEITGLFVAAVSTPVLSIAIWLILSRLFKEKNKRYKSFESMSKELNELYKVLSEENLRNLNLIFLDKTKELLDGQKNFEDIFLFNELKYANVYLNQFIKSLNAGNKNPYLLYKTKHFLIEGMEKIPSLYTRKKIEDMVTTLEMFEKWFSS